MSDKLDEILLKSQGDFLKDGKTNIEIREEAKAAILAWHTAEVTEAKVIGFMLSEGYNWTGSYFEKLDENGTATVSNYRQGKWRYEEALATLQSQEVQE